MVVSCRTRVTLRPEEVASILREHVMKLRLEGMPSDPEQVKLYQDGTVHNVGSGTTLGSVLCEFVWEPGEK